MSTLSAHFFTWVQGAPFYVASHREAVALLPFGQSKTWLDVGCGPGLVARLAADRAYDALGVDLDPAMVKAASRLARSHSQCHFVTQGLSDIASDCKVDVVSAASLLFVVPDRQAVLRQLWAHVKPGGHLLVIETTPKMTPAFVRTIQSHMPAGRRLALALWARVRRGCAVPSDVFDVLLVENTRYTPLLHGALGAWVMQKPS